MHNTLITNLILLLTLFNLTLADLQKYPAALLVRQTTTTSTSPQCLDYAMTANMSTIGANSTYRSAFLQASNVGTLKNSQMLDAAIKKLPALTANAALNQQCGNLTTVAATEAANNFTLGTVAQFSNIKGNPQQIFAGPGLAVIVAAVVFLQAGVWVFMP